MHNIRMKHPDFAARFKKACLDCKRAPTSQNQLGAFLGVSGPFISLLRNGERLPSTAKGQLISTKLGVSFDWLMQGGELRIVTSDDEPYIPSLEIDAISWCITFIDNHITPEMMKVRDNDWKAKIFIALYDLYNNDQSVKELKDGTVLKLINM